MQTWDYDQDKSLQLLMWPFSQMVEQKLHLSLAAKVAGGDVVLSEHRGRIRLMFTEGVDSGLGCC